MENQILKEEEEVLALLKNKINSLLEQGEEITSHPLLIDKWTGTEYRIGAVSSMVTYTPPTWVIYHLKVKEEDYRDVYSGFLFEEVYHFIKSKYDNIEELRKRKEIIESLEYLKEKV